MVPARLHLRNFMCYREIPELDFTGVHLACLCGENGRGKSALIDAMTWALWGKARASSDDELIHLGSKEMEVDFEFFVEDQLYRIIRKRTKSTPRHRGQSILQFFVAESGDFRDISANTISGTERKISDTLHLDYQTFINSALLLQGRADEFTTKRPGERKEVLGKILGLSYYNQLEESARELSREKEKEKANMESRIAELEAELGRKGEYEKKLHQVQNRLSEIETKLKAEENRLQELREVKRRLDLKKQELTGIEQNIKQAKEELEFWEEQRRRHEEKIGEQEAILAREAEIEEGYAQLVSLRRENDELNQRREKRTVLNEQKSEVEKGIAWAKAELEAEWKQAQDRAKELETRSAEQAKLTQELEKVRVKASEISSREEKLKEGREREKELIGRISHLDFQNKNLEEEVKALQDKIALLDQKGTQCPLCETELGREGRERIKEKLSSELKEKSEIRSWNKDKLQGLTKEYEVLQREVTELEEKTNQEQKEWQGRKTTLERELAEAKEATEELERVKVNLGQLEERLKKGDFALPEREKLGEILRHIKDLAYDGERHELVQEKLPTLEEYEERYWQLKEAKRQIEEEKEALKKAEGAKARWHSHLQTESRKKVELSQEILIFPQVAENLAEVEGNVQSLQSQRQEEGQHLGAVKRELERCTVLEREKVEKSQALRWAAEEKGIYEELALAFGKKGIPALIIEYICPEVEEEANHLLSRMTDGRMRVELETQRKTKKEEPVETLLIKIRDELGVRNYDLYSGGEAFRIDLALRLALSKLLARRAGAKLPTLVIDEGFGTQDSSGRERLVEAINSIQDDFDKIFVITHIEEMKEAFPVRLEVTKTEKGSQVKIS